MASRFICAGICTLLMITRTEAQFRLPSFDVSLKGGDLLIRVDAENPNGTDYAYEGFFTQAEINVHLGQRIAIGYFYNRNILTARYEGAAQQVNGKHLMHGANVRISGGKGAKFRPYLNVKLFRLEAVVEYNGYNLAAQIPGAAAGAGLMIKLNRKIYLNLPEVEIGSVFNGNDEVIFNGNTTILKISAGLTYNFSKRR